MTTFGPYTPARKAGNLLFISGQIGVNLDTKTASADVATQTSQALQNMENILLEYGVDLQHVVKTTVFLTTMDNFSAMNNAYEQAFTAPRPARSTVAVRELPRVAGDIQLLVEIEAVAEVEVA